eukprot:gb/GECG01002145.1/.p1 GENE.gb/GECG01002145.1/~~gb/GECG01002145.1/.p1  ORF type:complete len:1237 (+),score=253.12 gb/GECG01002145.1/:1-3711(+)
MSSQENKSGRTFRRPPAPWSPQASPAASGGSNDTSNAPQGDSPYGNTSTQSPRGDMGGLISRTNKMKMELGFEEAEDDKPDFGIELSSSENDEDGDDEQEGGDSPLHVPAKGTPYSGYASISRNRSTRLGQSGSSFGRDEDESAGTGGKDGDTTDEATRSKIIKIQAQYSRLQHDLAKLQRDLQNAEASRQHAQFFSKSHLIMIRQALLPRLQNKDTLLQELLQVLREGNNDQQKVAELERKVEQLVKESEQLEAISRDNEYELSSCMKSVQQQHPDLVKELADENSLPKLPSKLQAFFKECHLTTYLSAGEFLALLQLLGSLKDELVNEKKHKQRLVEEISGFKTQNAINTHSPQENHSKSIVSAREDNDEAPGNTSGDERNADQRELRSQIKKQKETIEFLRNILDSKQNVAAAHEQQNHSRASALSADNKQLKDEIHQLKKELETVRARLNNKDKEVHKLREELQSKDDNSSNSRYQLSSLKQKCASLQKQLRDEKLDKKRREEEVVTAEVDRLQHELSTAREELEKRKQSDSHNSGLETRNQQIEQELESVKLKLQETSEQLKRQREEEEANISETASKHQATMEASLAEARSLRDQLGVLQHKIKEQEVALAHSSHALSEQESKNSKAVTKKLFLRFKDVFTQHECSTMERFDHIKKAILRPLNGVQRSRQTLDKALGQVRKKMNNQTNRLRLQEEEWKLFLEKERASWQEDIKKASRDKTSAEQLLDSKLQELREEFNNAQKERDIYRKRFEEMQNTKQQAIRQYSDAFQSTLRTVQQLRDQLTSLKTHASCAIDGFYTTYLKPNKRAEKDTGVSLSTLSKAVRVFLEEYEDIKERYQSELKERRKIFNELQELRGNIRVFCRVRPLLENEAKQGDSNCVTVKDEQTIQVAHTKGKVKNWELDRVFDPDYSNDKVYEEAAGIATSVMDGYNACIFAYGQTGSGKTFTMEGTRESRGVNYRALQSLFTLRDERTRKNDFSYEIDLSMLEIYNESIRDMLVPKAEQPSKLTVRESAEGVHVPELSVRKVETLEDVMKVLREGHRNRTSFATNMNEHSSRSHAMVSVFVEGYNHVTETMLKGKLHLIDLAGSERVAKSGSTGERLKEAQNINRSLSALGDVIASRVAKKGHTPYRNSQLTYLLKDSLAGDSKTLMFVNVSPISSSCEESYASLNFASRVRNVELGKATKHLEVAGSGSDSPHGSSSPRSADPPTPNSGGGSRARAKVSQLRPK